jgi:SAM-dependent methyltransferase
MSLPTLGQMLLGTAGLALLRQAFGDDAAAREARVAEIRDLARRYHDDATLQAPLAAPEYDLAEGYARWSETYDRPLRLFPVEAPTVQALLQPVPAGRVLDAACGTGRHALWLAEQGHEVTGVDASEAMLDKARAKLPDACFLQGDLGVLPLADGSVDAALCALALVHVADLRPPFAEFARVVRRGGRIVISDVHPFLVQLGWQAQFRLDGGCGGFMRLNAHLPSDYAAAAKEAGLRIVSLHEPRLALDSAVTVARDLLPEANAAAWVGLPGVIVWELAKD